MRPDQIAVFVDPFTRHFERDALFDPEADAASDNAFEPFVYLRRFLEQRGISTHTADYLGDPKFERQVNLYFSFGLRHRYRELAKRPDVVLSSFFAFECPVVEPRLYRELERAGRYFKRIYSFSSEE